MRSANIIVFTFSANVLTKIFEKRIPLFAVIERTLNRGIYKV